LKKADESFFNKAPKASTLCALELQKVLIVEHFEIFSRMYLVAGMVAKNIAGPGVVFSFLIAAVASIFSG
jgi:hypothetical protein